MEILLVLRYWSWILVMDLVLELVMELVLELVLRLARLVLRPASKNPVSRIYRFRGVFSCIN